MEDYEEAASYAQRLDTAIQRIATLPTAEEWEAEQEQKLAREEAQRQAEQAQITEEQNRLEGVLNFEQRTWKTGTAGSYSAGPGVLSPVIEAPETESGQEGE